MKITRLLIMFLLWFQWYNAQTKINGISFVASREAINESHVKPVANVNANYVTVMPFGFVKHLNSPEVIYNTERQWFGETKKGVTQYIKELRMLDVKIMLKPQIWVWRGEYTGFITMNSEVDWKALEASYSKFILDYAQLAQMLKVELFCIGTELEAFSKNRPQYWQGLIKKIRSVYKGKLTYAANWDEFKYTSFWNDLDYIGIDAYFPVSNNKTPTVDDCVKGWKPHFSAIKNKQKKFGKPVLFTEFGYRSVDYTGKEPWKSDRSMNQVNLEAQTNATKALFDTFWKEDWFAGGFIWKWFHNYNHVGGKENSMFTPQNKPVELLIKEHYAHFK